MCSRLLLSFRDYDHLSQCDPTVLGGPIYFDGTRLHAIKRAMNYTGNRLLKVMHGLEKN